VVSSRNSTLGDATSRKGRRILCALSAMAGLSLASEAAHAQQKTFYLDRVQVSSAPDDGFVVWRPYVHEKTRFYGAATLGFTLDPLRAGTIVDNPNIERRIDTPVTNQWVMHLGVGAEFMNRFGVSLQLPVNVWQGGNDPTAEIGGNGIERTPVAVYDLRLAFRARVYESDNHKFQLGVGAVAWLPTGNATAFAGDDQVTGQLYGAAEYNFGKFLVAGHIGPHFRPYRNIAGEDAVLEVGSELRWTAGIFLPLRQNDVRLGGSLWGTTGIESLEKTGNTFFNGRNTDVEWLAEARFLLEKRANLWLNVGGGTRLSSGYGSPDIRLLAQIGAWTSLLDFSPGQAIQPRRKAPDVEMHDKDTDGDGYPDEIDACPTEKEDGQKPEPDDGCPAPKDRDHDGIPDDADKCPDDPEDKDGIMDGDGCPEKDADNDGIPDTEDACPLVPGVKNADPKKNGCKEERKKIIETESGLQLLEPIQFDTGKATIKRVSFPILDEVYDVMKERPNVKMGVYGHTDSQGGHDMNVKLSGDRAASVVRYLVTKGIAANRLESKGFGPDQPLGSNDTAEGKAKNRRVEFKILEQ
jgi:OOP family OmpA-OmpF porin